jgi:hypothetical protein
MQRASIFALRFGGITVSSESVAVGCSSSAEDSGCDVRLAFEGTLTCAAPNCNLNTIETDNLIAEKTKDI